MQHTSEIILDQSALKHNFDFIRGLLGEQTILSSVVKGNAYGHGIEPFVKMAHQEGVSHFSVFSADEAHRVRNVIHDSGTIMIMGMMEKDQLHWAIENEIEFFVFNTQRLVQAAEHARKCGVPANVHIEVETGMNRTGFDTRDLPSVLDYINKHNSNLNFKGICTHFAGAESIANYYRIKRQVTVFERAHNKTIRSGLQPALRHTACSAATLRYPKTRMEMVRIGILQYGFFPSKEILIYHLARKGQTEYPLRRIITWKSRVMSTKSVKKGEFIGYGTSYLSNNDLRIAIVPVGYSHGFSRALSNQGRALIHGQRVSVLGTVNMNMITIDITSIDNVNIGDEVVLIGKQGDHEISVASFSDFSDQINYELLTRLPSRIPRTIIEK